MKRNRISRYLSCLSLAALLLTAATGSGDAEPLFQIQELFVKERIPKIIVAQDGSVLAFAKACKLLRRSADGGATWSEAVKGEG